MTTLLFNASGIKILGVGSKHAGWGNRQDAAKQQLQKRHEAEVEAAFQRGLQQGRQELEAFKEEIRRKLGL